MISQAINGFYPATNSLNLDGTRNPFPIPIELSTAFGELEQFISQLPTQFSGWSVKVEFGEFLPLNRSSQGSSGLKATSINSAIGRFFEMIQSSGMNSSGIASSATVSSANAAFRQNLLQPFHQDCLQETYLLYDGLESVMKVALETLCSKEKNPDTAASRKLISVSFSSPLFGNGLIGRSEKDFIEVTESLCVLHDLKTNFYYCSLILTHPPAHITIRCWLYRIWQRRWVVRFS
jgi:hypothetical protein